MRIGIAAPACRLDPALGEQLKALTAHALGGSAPELVIHPQCFLAEGHFAGPDAARADAIVELANDEAIDAIWFARGGYGSNRIAEDVIGRLGPAARAKTWVGYSDAGFLLSGLYRNGIGRIAHGPMPADLAREGGETAVLRVLAWLSGKSEEGLAEDEDAGGINLSPPLTGGRDPLMAFNLTVLSQLLGTPLEPDFTDHVLMLEEVSEYAYRIDRAMFHITSSDSVRRVAGIRLGRCSEIPENDPDFGADAETIVRYWCDRAGIRFLGAADIGHDAANRIVVFG